MKNAHRFLCPECGRSASERQEEILTQIDNWVSSDAMGELTEAFGGKKPSGNLKEKITGLNEFAEVWDYRKKAAGAERWELTEDPELTEKKDLIMDCVTRLGLVSITEPAASPDYIVPLGGARRSNYARPLKAREVIDGFGLSGKKVVGLSSLRPINDIERPFVDAYAPGAKNEYEAMCAGIAKSFGLVREEASEDVCSHENMSRQRLFTEDFHNHENVNLRWAVTEFNEAYAGNRLSVLAAPSSDPGRRANSRDTFEFLLEKMSIKPGDRLLLVTSCIYVPFQLLRFMDLAVERGFYVDCIGMENNDSTGTAFSHLANYCQETKAAVNAAKALVDRWV